MSYRASFSMRQQATVEKYFISGITGTNFGVWRQSIPSVRGDGEIGYTAREQRA
jgi:hypothetical protein